MVLDVVVTDETGQTRIWPKAVQLHRTRKRRENDTADLRGAPRRSGSAPSIAAGQQVLAPNVFSNVRYARQWATERRADGCTEHPDDRPNVRARAMLEYARKAPEGTRIAILGLSNRLYLLQGVTTDPAVVKAAAQMFMAEKAPVPPQLRGRYTLAAIDELARYLSGLPGRKNLIWFAGSFNLGIVPDGDRANRFGSLANFADDAKRTANLLTRSRVAVYPIDALGLFSDPDLSAGVALPPGAQMLGPSAWQISDGKFLGQRADKKITMNMLAERTGGKAFYDTNGLKDALQQAINNGSNYYTLAYAPTDRKWDGRYRSVRVKLEQSDVDLFYRQGYFAYDPVPRARARESRSP